MRWGLPCDLRCGRDVAFDSGEIEETVARKGLLALEIEVGPGQSECEIRDVVGQAKALGARYVSLVGGDPMRHPAILDLVSWIRGQALGVGMFTDGRGVSADGARFLLARRVKVILRMESGRGGLRKGLTCDCTADGPLPGAFRNLRDAGYPAPDAVLGVSVNVGAENREELTSFWRWLREQGLEPHFEMPRPMAHGVRSWGPAPPGQEVHSIFSRLAEIDRTLYGVEWVPQPPVAASACLRNRVSCFVAPSGDVMPCQGVTIPIGNVREKRLADILRESEILEDLRGFRETIKGPCVQCDRFARCHGCRGTAFRLTGDYLASDPLCWRNVDQQSRIERLPLRADVVLPHRWPMRIVDTLRSIGERTAVVELVVPERGPFVGENGLLDRVAYPEILAQAIAAWNGFMSRGRRGLPRGYLLGIKRFTFHGTAGAGDSLVAVLSKVGRFGKFGIIEGRVSRGEELMAKGEIKVWHENPS